VIVMQTKRFLPLLALAAIAILGFAPMASASPITASLNWSVEAVPSGSPTTATVSVAIDTDCPSGQTFTGTITITEPDGISVATYAVGPTPCGSNVAATYPSAFSGTAGTSELGAYSAVWAGSTSAIVGGQHPTFSLTDNFIVISFPPPVPEFAAPAMAVAAMGLVLLALVRRGRTLKI
jgi:hypothetical protein